MLYLGIDQHARQITISLRDDGGDVLQARQVSTQPDKINAFFRQLTRERLHDVTVLVAERDRDLPCVLIDPQVQHSWVLCDTRSLHESDQRDEIWYEPVSGSVPTSERSSGNGWLQSTRECPRRVRATRTTRARGRLEG